jgi:hypothetical protein
LRYLARLPRFRQAVFAACLPYLLVSVFVDFVHVHAPVRMAVSAQAGESAIGGPGERPAPPRDYTCTACLWLRTGLQLVSNAPARLSSQAATSAALLLPSAMWPDGPAVSPALLRGPPPSLLV